MAKCMSRRRAAFLTIFCFLGAFFFTKLALALEAKQDKDLNSVSSKSTKKPNDAIAIGNALTSTNEPTSDASTTERVVIVDRDMLAVANQIEEFRKESLERSAKATTNSVPILSIIVSVFALGFSVFTFFRNKEDIRTREIREGRAIIGTTSGDFSNVATKNPTFSIVYKNFGKTTGYISCKILSCRIVYAFLDVNNALINRSVQSHRKSGNIVIEPGHTQHFKLQFKLGEIPIRYFSAESELIVSFTDIFGIKRWRRITYSTAEIHDPSVCSGEIPFGCAELGNDEGEGDSPPSRFHISQPEGHQEVIDISLV